MTIIEKIKKIIGAERIKHEELDQLESFVENFDKSEEVDQWLKQNWDKAFEGELLTNDLDDESTNLKHIVVSKDRFENRFTFRKIAAVAIALLTLSVSAWLFVNSKRVVNLKLAKTQKNEKTINNLVNSVVLEQGEQTYDLTKNEIDLKEGQLNIVGDKDKLKMVSGTPKATKEQKWNILKIPRGKDYYVMLSDSTQVWMNACSELSFPDRFIEGKREVHLKGEAYFIVKSDVKNPFYVKTSKSTVQVTGTKFNVCSYEEEEQSLVTLIEGIVGVSVDGKMHKIKPGQQFIQDTKGTEIVEVDPYQYISWKEGVFEFNDMSLSDMALRLSKWYDIEFKFENTNVSLQRFTGMIKKEHDIKYFISVLEKTTSLNFKQEGTKIIVSEKRT